MLTVKDFEKGQKAYIVTDDHGTRENKIFEATVKTVGRKYVTLDDSWGSRYQTCANDYLTEVAGQGCSLRPNRQRKTISKSKILFFRLTEK